MSVEQSQRGADRTAWWYQASFLRERLPVPSPLPPLQWTQEQEKRAIHRLERWRRVFGSDDDLYKTWLEYVSLSEQDLLFLFAEPPEELQQRLSDMPDWLETFSAAFDHQVRNSDAFLEPLLLREESQPKKGGARLLLTLVEPLLRLACEQLTSDIQVLEQRSAVSIVEAEGVVFSLLPSLLAQLQNMLGRTLILEFHLARLQGRFPEASDLQEGLRAYAHSLSRRETSLAFFSEYPVLARQTTICIEQWRESNREMFTHLYKDWPALCDLFCSGHHPGALQGIQPQVGNAHREGRSVQILSFASGFRLVYKPRSLAIDQHFQEVLQWLNVRGQNPAWRVLRVLPAEDHGWMEYIEPQECASHEEVERFYLRQGAHLALLYALEAVDCHFENIVAAGEYPVLVDLESLLHARTESLLRAFSPSDQLAREHMASSVLRTLLLPTWLYGEENEEGVEIGGLGGAPGQRLPQHLFHAYKLDDETLQFMRQQATLPGGQNRPRLHGEEVNSIAYLSQIIEGFTNTYRLLLSLRREFLAKDGPLARFASDTVRVILRPTALYSRVLQESFHPYLLHDALDRERMFNLLWLDVQTRPQMKILILSEQNDLLRGDIPLFTTSVASCDLWTSSGECFSQFFARSGFESVQQRWHHLSERDLQRQLWFIRASFASVMVEEDGRQVAAASEIEEASWLVPLLTSAEIREDVLTAACRVGDRLCDLAMHTQKKASWLGLTQVQEKHWTIAAADLNLYHGLPGIVLALAYLGKLTRISRYTDIARAGYAALREWLTQGASEELRTIGFFSGWGGVIATLTHLAVLWKESDLLHEALTIVARLPPLIDQDERLDITRGSAGCLAGLLCLAKVAPHPLIDEVLLQCGERLVARAVRMPAGVGWKTIEGTAPLAGFAHGATGFAWALLKLSQHTRPPRFQQVAREALAYERSLFSPEHGGWRDGGGGRFPERGQEAYSPATWCHGASGIGLARLDTLEILHDEVIEAEIRAAFDITLAKGNCGNHSLCHGDLGNLEFLSRAQSHLSDRRRLALYELARASVLEAGSRSGWLCGTPQHVETPGLMVGLAGICLQLLRLAEPACVPSFLTMDAPVENDLNEYRK